MSDCNGRRRLSTPKPVPGEAEPDDLDVIVSHLEGLDRDQLAELGEWAEGVLRLVGYFEGVLDVHAELADDEEEE